MSLGRWIRSARLDRQLTQWNLADLVATSQSTISIWERGRRLPTNQELVWLEKTLKSPLRALAYANDELPLIVERLLATGEVLEGRNVRLSTQLAIRRDGFLVATPLFVQLLRGSDNPGDLARNWLNASTTSDGIRFPVISGEIPAPAASAIYQDSLVPIASDVMSDSYAANPVSRDETWPTERTGILSRLAASGVARPLWPSSYQLGSDRKVAFGYCIPTASPDVRGKVIEHAEDVLEDPLHAVLVQLATLRLFSSIETRTSLLVHDRSLSLKLQSRTWEWEGSLIDALKRLLSIAHLEAVESEALPIAWQDAVHIALENLARLRVLVFSGPRIDPAKRFVSLLSASPRHPANRPEKGFRARLSAELPQLFANRGAA